MSYRPVFLNLLQIKLPVTALVSILHRVSGVAIFLAMPALLYWMCLVTHSEASFSFIDVLASVWWAKTIMFLILIALIYHVVAGTRHLIHDFSHIHGIKCMRHSAWLTLIVSAVIVVLTAWRMFIL